MSKKTYNANILKKARKSAEGFSLIETTVALTTLGICLAYAMPLFLYAKINNSKSKVRTGALIVSQRVFDDIRSQSISSLPSTQGANVTISDPLILKAMGREYTASVTYCQVITECSDKYRKFKVEVNHNGSKAYDLEGTYTDFQ